MYKVKYIADISTPTKYTGYLVDNTLIVPLVEGNRQYQEAQNWIADGNTPEVAYTQEELKAYTNSVGLYDAKLYLSNSTSLLPQDVQDRLTQAEKDAIVADRLSAIAIIEGEGRSGFAVSDLSLAVLNKYKGQ